MTSSHGRGWLVLLLLTAACSSVGSDPGGECSYGGTVHASGTTFPSTDGCNSCTCDPQGGVACTLLGCVGDGGAAACTYNGGTHAPGSSFPSADGCNSCGCSATGAVTCTERACDDLCTLDATYTFGPNGGLVAYIDVATLTPPGVYTYTRAPAGTRLLPPAVSSCAPALPACRTDGAIDVANIMVDLMDRDVEVAFATVPAPLYGGDSRPVDGQVFEVKRSTGGSFLVGSDCPSPTSSSCPPIPAGVAKLVADLRALNEQQLADPTCAALRP